MKNALKVIAKELAIAATAFVIFGIGAVTFVVFAATGFGVF